MTHPFATRRGVIAGLLAVAAARPLAAATAVPEAATLLAPGPEEGAAATYAQRAARGLARGLVHAAAMRVSVLGGADGITAANRFAVTAPADGRMLLALPGQSAQALLIGDPRARFEPRQWPAVTASLVPALLAGRGPLAAAHPPRLALAGPGAPEVAGLLALEMLGRAATPVFLPAAMAPEAAVAVGSADAIVLTGGGAVARAAALGLTPWFAFDLAAGGRDPHLPDVPALGELLADPAHPDLLAGCRAAAAAMRARAVVVLPTLTPADSVALWREAARRWGEAEPDAAEAGAHRVHAQAAADLLATLCPAPGGVLAYREWLHRRLAFQAG
ncbi:hypothetical protein DFH01_02845 [Falsiroseomonas bella]|uniref:Uncharacterized protein n=1 Tax=Falsiroseomonas bella TaxID=2184016 RepID=A0A317FJV9_9PROT|nr:hypothetical protein [Falsiroseomonas bella]PWS38249.1 hypothetical protein DFH01_02845 [Falsiroseomonas bella]